MAIVTAHVTFHQLLNQIRNDSFNSKGSSLHIHLELWFFLNFPFYTLI